MIILRQKLYFEKLLYLSFKDRAKDAIVSAIKSCGAAATLGALEGAINGIEAGDIIGGAFSSTVSSAINGLRAGFMSSINRTSKKTIDLINENQQLYEDYINSLTLSILKGPAKIFQKSLGNSKIKIQKFLGFEKKFKILWPEDFYKFIQIQESFIPIASLWAVLCAKSGIPLYVFDWYSYIWPCCYPEDVQNWLKKNPTSVAIALSVNTPTKYIAYDFEKLEYTSWRGTTGLELKPFLIQELSVNLERHLKRLGNGDYDLDEEKAKILLLLKYIKHILTKL